MGTVVVEVVVDVAVDVVDVGAGVDVVDAIVVVDFAMAAVVGALGVVVEVGRECTARLAGRDGPNTFPWPRANAPPAMSSATSMPPSQRSARLLTVKPSGRSGRVLSATGQL